MKRPSPFLITRITLALMGVLWAVRPAGAVNYIINPGAEDGNFSGAFTLQYVGPASTATFWVDVPNNRFVTYTNGMLDYDIDLSDLAQYEEQGDLRAVFDADPDYTTANIGWAGQTVIDAWSSTDQYADDAIAAFPGESILAGYPVQARLANSWSSVNTSSGSSSLFSRNGKYSLNVYDNRPNAPGRPLEGSPETVLLWQNLAVSNPANWTDLLGQVVELSGYVRHPQDSLLSDSSDGASLTVTHGNGGSIIEVIKVAISNNNDWVSFSDVFQVDPASTEITIRLYAVNPLSNVYNGNGHVLYDDLSLEIVTAVAFDQVTVEDTVGMEFLSVSGITYRLESTTDLVTSNNFTSTGAFVEGNDGTRYLFDPAGFSTGKVYRILQDL